MSDALASLVGLGLRWIPPLVLVWLAVFFGRSLRSGATPLIERIARHSRPALPAVLCRYTRRLTALWCCYFGIAAAAGLIWPGIGAWAGVGAALLFVGERWLRPRFFPDEVFPSLAQQLRDTWSVWRVRG